MVAPLAGGSGASCCVVRGAPGVLWVLLASVRQRLRVGEGLGVCGCWLGVMCHRRLPSLPVPWRVSRRCLRTYGWSLGAGRLRGWTCRGWSASASMTSHAACGIHSPRRLEAAVLHQPLAGQVDQVVEGGLCPGLLLQLPELRVGPVPPPLSLGGAVALGGEVGVGECGGVVGTDGGGGPEGVLVVLSREGAWGVGWGWMWTRGYASTVSAWVFGRDSRWRR